MTRDSQPVLVEKLHDYAVIRFNRAERKNAILEKMFGMIARFLNTLAVDDSTKLVVITGNGDYFTSGMDVGEHPPGETKHLSLEKFRSFIEAITKFPKPIIAAVNGPAIGFGVTALPLTDVVYAADNSTFLTPFSRIGIVPEACSSYTFPKLMGYAKANAVLLFNQKLTAHEALEAGLVSEVFPQQRFWSEVQKRIDEYRDLPEKSLVYGKRLIREAEIQKLLEANRMEMEQTKERYYSGDVAVQAQKFFLQRKRIREARKSKL